MRTYKTTYTKHYYIEGERICSKIGGGFEWAHTPPTSPPIDFIVGDPYKCSIKLRDMVERNAHCANYDGDMYIEPYLPPAHNNGNEYEILQYFYHSDHLGSASFVTNAGGYVEQHLQYLPFGEIFVSQRNSEFDSRYKFTAKELDNETNYMYFGARYYDSDLSVWISVDPMSDKYPSTSAYMYCAGNPVILIDPNGEKVYIVGDAADEATTQLQNNFTNIKITRNTETGELSYTGKAKTLKEQFIVKAIERTDIEVNIIAENHPIYLDTYTKTGSGSYLGNEIIKNEDGTTKAIGKQFVIPEELGKMDLAVGDNKTGGYMLHEVAEAYYGCEIALERNVGSPYAPLSGNTWAEAHRRANDISCGDYSPKRVKANRYHIYNLSIPFKYDPFNMPYLEKPDSLIYKRECQTNYGK